MSLLAISVDEPDASRSFANNYRIEYPLLTDRGGAVSRAYVGVDANDHAVPGVVVIGRDGRTVFRQIAETKDDRLTAAQLLATVDRALGTSGGAPQSGYAALERLQLRFDIGGGQYESSYVPATVLTAEPRRVHDWSTTAVASLALMYPLGRYVLAGPSLRYEARAAPLDLDLALTLRAPILGDAAAVQLTALGGYTPGLGSEHGWNAAVRGGVWVAFNPQWAFHLDATNTAHWYSGTRMHDITVTLGLSMLLQIR